MTETPETNAARRSSGLRAIADGLRANPDLSVAQKVICDAAAKIEELERERNGLHALHNKNAAYSAELLELCGTLRKERDVLLQAIINLRDTNGRYQTQQAFEYLMTLLLPNQNE